MKAIVVRETGGVEVMRLDDVEPPEPRPNEVRIEVEACGVCFHDVVTRNGVMKRGVSLPFIPGHEVSGIIDTVGPLVQDFKRGDRVTTAQRRHVCGRCRYCRTGRETGCAEREFLGDGGLNGGYAEMVCVGEENVTLVPDGVKLDEAAVVSCAIGTGLNAIRDVAHVQPGERVLITGAGGGLGIHGVQIARLAGAHVIAVTTSEEKIEPIRQAGAHEVLLVGKGEDFSARVKKATGGAGVDVAIDNVGSAVFQPTRRSLAAYGRWVFVGQLTGEFVQLNPAQIFMQAITIQSAKSTSREQLRDALELVRRGQVKPMITGRMALEDAPRVHKLVESGQSTGRILLRPAA